MRNENYKIPGCVGSTILSLLTAILHVFCHWLFWAGNNLFIDRQILLTARMGWYDVKVALLRCLMQLIIYNTLHMHYWVLGVGQDRLFSQCIGFLYSDKICKMNERTMHIFSSFTLKWHLQQNKNIVCEFHTVETQYKEIWYNKLFSPVPMNQFPLFFYCLLTTDITKYLI